MDEQDYKNALEDLEYWTNRKRELIEEIGKLHTNEAAWSMIKLMRALNNATTEIIMSTLEVSRMKRGA